MKQVLPRLSSPGTSPVAEKKIRRYHGLALRSSPCSSSSSNRRPSLLLQAEGWGVRGSFRACSRFNPQVGNVAGEEPGCGRHPRWAPLLLTFPAPLPLRQGAPEDVEAGGQDGGHPTDHPPVPHHPGPKREGGKEGGRYDRSPSGRRPTSPGPSQASEPARLLGVVVPSPGEGCPLPPSPQGSAGRRGSSRRAPPSVSPAGARRDPLRSQPDLAEPPARRSRRSTAVARSVSSRPKRLSGIPGLAALRGRN